MPPPSSSPWGPSTREMAAAAAADEDPLMECVGELKRFDVAGAHGDTIRSLSSLCWRIALGEGVWGANWWWCGGERTLESTTAGANAGRAGDEGDAAAETTKAAVAAAPSVRTNEASASAAAGEFSRCKSP